jgi:hypothetical protein
MKRLVTALVLVAVLASAAPRRGRRNMSLRKRLHVNPLIVDPGTAELEWDGQYSYLAGEWSIPASFRITPDGPGLLWGRTEYDINWSSPAVQWAATTLLFDGQHLDVAIMPQASLFVRDEKGARLGGTLVGRYDMGLNSFGATLSWSGATHSSTTNPAGTADVGFGFGRQWAESGWRSRFSPHVNTVWERSTGVAHTWSAFEGVEYQISSHFAFDVSGQHLGNPGGPVDHQVVFALTVGVGKPR